LALLASSVGDPAGTRTITSIVALLAALGIALIMLAFWLFRVTRPDKELLAPLEVMGERKWRRADPVWQRRRLDEVRPDKAQPLQPSAAPPDFDEAFDHGPTASGFDDLHEDAREHGEPASVPVEVPAAPPADTDGNGDGSAAEGAAEGQRAASRRPVSPTPIGIERPMDLPDRDIDPELLAAAIAELDAELRLGHDGNPQSSD
jgi:hypothetical protein